MRDFEAPKHEVSLAPATKSRHHMPKYARQSAVVRSARRGPPFSELAGHARAVHIVWRTNKSFYSSTPWTPLRFGPARARARSPAACLPDVSRDGETERSTKSGSRCGGSTCPYKQLAGSTVWKSGRLGNQISKFSLAKGFEFRHLPSLEGSTHWYCLIMWS